MPGFTDVLRRAFSWGRGEAEGVDVLGQQEGINYDDILAQLNIVKSEVDRYKLKLLGEINEYHTKLVGAIRAHDNESIEINASELVIKKRVYKLVASYGHLIGIAIERIKDARTMEAITKALAPLHYAMGAISNYLSGLAPDATASLASVFESTESVIRKVNVLSSVLPEGRSLALLDDDVKKAISEAMAEAQAETEKLTPQVPRAVSPEELEAKLIEYIKASGGVIRVSKVAEELGVSPAAVRDMLARLEAKGVLKVEGLGQRV
jgi:predicted transcriptional regulator